MGRPEGQLRGRVQCHGQRELRAPRRVTRMTLPPWLSCTDPATIVTSMLCRAHARPQPYAAPAKLTTPLLSASRVTVTSATVPPRSSHHGVYTTAPTGRSTSLADTRWSSVSAPGPVTSILPNELTSMIPACSRTARPSATTRSNHGGRVQP